VHGRTHRSTRPSWRDPASIRALLTGLVPSAEPAVAFTSLAAACVSRYADECSVEVIDDEQAAFSVRYPPIAAASGASSVITIPIQGDPCAGEPGYFADVTFGWVTAELDDADSVIAQLVTEHVAALITRERLAGALQRESGRATHLGEALDSNRQIGQAVGILMASHKLTHEQAFDLLRGVSQHTHRKLRDVADGVNHTGALDLRSLRAPATSANQLTT
jgi:hypothetical protein